MGERSNGSRRGMGSAGFALELAGKQRSGGNVGEGCWESGWNITGTVCG